MKTIEERAFGIYPKDSICDSICRHGYTNGATDQRQIDIEMACEWLEQQIYDSVIVDTGNGSYDEHLKSEFIRDFKEAMNEI